MNKIINLFKKTFKIILWVIISIVLLLIIVAGLIQIPSIQNKIVNYATTFVSNKTHTEVGIKKISISFPKSVVIEGLYLEDLEKDTLLYAEEIKINIAFTDLFNNMIHVSSFALKNIDLNLNRAEKDSVFNYNFLITSFSDTTKTKNSEPKKASKWAFSLDDLSMRNIRLSYNDYFGGTNVVAHLKHLSLKMDQIDLVKSIFEIDELLIDSLNASVLVKKSEKNNDKEPAGALPKIVANKIEIRNTNFNYGDSVGKQSLSSNINNFTLKNASLDLQQQVILIDDISLSKSKLLYSKTENIASDTISKNDSPVEKNNWKISAKNINVDDNSITYTVANKPEIKKTFDASHLDYKNLTLEAKNFYYSSDQTKISIRKFTAIDQNDFSVTKFETDFEMDQHSITAKNLKVKTGNSSITANIHLHYSSLNSLKDSIQSMVINADLKNSSFNNYDILYFSPELSKQAFFKNTQNVTTFSGVINGPLNNLKGKNVIIQTGINTTVKTDFTITGLPDMKIVYFDFPNLKVTSGKNDIAMMAGPAIPKSIEFPENINMHIVFKGQIKAFESTVGISSSYGSANIFASIDKNENFKSKLNITDFDLGSLLKNKEMFGPVSLSAETKGHGLDKKTISAKIKAEVSEIYLNKYNYHNLSLNGNINGQEFEGKINLKDPNAAFDFDGLVNLNPDEEQYKFNFDLLGADLKKLNLTDEDIRISLNAVSDLKGGSVSEINGKAGITKIIVVHEGNKYVLDSVLIASINESDKSELNISSAIVGINYTGVFPPSDLSGKFNKYLNSYFAFSDSIGQTKEKEMQDFKFEIQLHNHPIISEVFLPQLKEFEPGLIQGSFDKEKQVLLLNATIKKIVYGANEVNDFLLNVNSDASALNYKISCSNVSNSQFKLDNFVLAGKLADNKIFTSISSIDSNQNKKLLISSQITKDDGNYKLALEPENFYIMNEHWSIANDNYVKFGKKGFLIHHLFINKAESQINIASVNDKFNDDLNLEIKNFKLEDISRIIEKDTVLIKGNVDGNVFLKRIDSTYGIIADAKIKNLVVREVPIGDLSLKAENPTAAKFNIDVNLSGNENDLTANGYFVPKGGDNSININTTIRSLSMKTIEAFSMGQITKASGNVTGNFLINGSSDSPDITGELTFNNTLVTPASLNNQLELKHETIQLKKDGIYFNSFTILDTDQHQAVVDGNVKMEHFKNFIFGLKVNTKDFLLFNTTKKDNKEFYGRMIIDSRIDVNGPMDLPVINAKVKIKKGSNFTFAVQEKTLTTDKGEDVVEFVDTSKLNEILVRNDKDKKQKTTLTGFDISSIIEIDKQATLRLLLDPTSSDSLVVKGEAALSFAIDRSGKMSLTGAYNINEGSYAVSLESVIKRKFIIDPGSTIIWNGDPMDAQIVINAIYSVRASPIDLVADQTSGLSESDKLGYKQRYPFLVYLKMRGEIKHPEISFEIQLAPEDKGILGGSVNAKLNSLNEDPSALNKQVFSLLVLGRFTQENPLSTETDAMSNAARTTVGKFLSAQLNQMSSKMVPGVELNFDIQSYDEYQTGQAEGRTQVEIGAKKQLFNERLAVQIGGSVDVEGEKAKQNSASDITGDVTVEYKLTKDGRYRLKGFRHNQYEGAIEGQLVQTGAGILYVRDFNKWKEFFKKPKNKIDSPTKTNNNDEIKNK